MNRKIESEIGRGNESEKKTSKTNWLTTAAMADCHICMTAQREEIKKIKKQKNKMPHKWKCCRWHRNGEE